MCTPCSVWRAPFYYCIAYVTEHACSPLRAQPRLPAVQCVERARRSGATRQTQLPRRPEPSTRVHSIVSRSLTALACGSVSHPCPGNCYYRVFRTVRLCGTFVAQRSDEFSADSDRLPCHNRSSAETRRRRGNNKNNGGHPKWRRRSAAARQRYPRNDRQPSGTAAATGSSSSSYDYPRSSGAPSATVRCSSEQQQ